MGEQSMSIEQQAEFWSVCCRDAEQRERLALAELEQLRARVAELEAPIPMLLFCPRCGVQHIDAPAPERGWDDPPHRSHECQGCALVWRPADVATTGVLELRTKGKADWPAHPARYAYDWDEQRLRAKLDAARATVERVREVAAKLEGMTSTPCPMCTGSERGYRDAAEMLEAVLPPEKEG